MAFGSDRRVASLDRRPAFAPFALRSARGILSVTGRPGSRWLQEARRWGPKTLLVAVLHYAILMALPITLLGLPGRFVLAPIAVGFALEVVRSGVRRGLRKRVRARFLREVALRALDKRSLTADADVEAAFWAAYMIESAVSVDAPAVVAALCAGLSIFALAVPMLGNSLVAWLLALLSMMAALTLWSNRSRIALVEAVVHQRQLTANWIAAAERDGGEIYGERARDPFLARLGEAAGAWSAVEDRLERARLWHRILLAGAFCSGLFFVLRAQHIDLVQLASSQQLTVKGLSGLLLLGTGIPAAYVFVVHADLLVMARAALIQIMPPPDGLAVPQQKLARRPERLCAQALSFGYASPAPAVFETSALMWTGERLARDRTERRRQDHACETDLWRARTKRRIAQFGRDRVR